MEDLTGKRFGKWLVLSLNKEKTSRSKYRYWNCICDCGTTKAVNENNLIYNKSKSCGCVAKSKNRENKLKDLTGNKYGRALVVGLYTGEDSYKYTKDKRAILWECECDCGKHFIASGRSLRSGNTKSCGCLKSELSSKRFSLDLTGKTFGKLEVLGRAGTFVGSNGTQYSKWLCRCECGTLKEIVGHSLISGAIKSCGCMSSYGEYKIRKILTEDNIQFVTQYSFDDLVSDKNRKLRFDFAIFIEGVLICLIEYQGEQHFKASNRFPNFGLQQREVTDGQKKRILQEE